MPERLKPLLEANRLWAAAMEERRPGFFSRLARQQNPRRDTRRWPRSGAHTSAGDPQGDCCE